MTTDVFGSTNTKATRSERANRAVRAFKAMLPGLNGYAQAITGDRMVKVEITDISPRTDGKKIYFKPPIELGDLRPHVRNKCDMREPDTGLQECLACRTREEVLISIYHEIAHIIYGTFEPPTDAAKAELFGRVLQENGSKYAKALRAQWEQIPDYKKKDYLNLSSLISPFLPVLVNALEDARVDENMFRARRGTKAMFDAHSKSVFSQGIKQDDGTYDKWAERPLNSQILVGVFVLAAEYKYEGWFHPDVEKALADKELRELVRKVDTNTSATDSYTLAFPVLARLRQLGFCKTDQDPENEENEDEEDQPDDEGEGAPDGDSDDPEASGGSDESAEQSDSEREDGSGADEGDEGSPQDEEAVSDDESGDDGEADGGSDADSDEGSGISSDGTGDEEAGSDESGPGGQGSPDDSEAERGDQPLDEGPGDSPGTDGPEHDDRQGSSSEPEGEAGGEGSPEGSNGADRGDRQSSGEDSEELIDTGADDGSGGTETDSRPEYGSPEQALEDIQVFSQHEPPSNVGISEIEDQKAIQIAVRQGEYFESPSTNVLGVRQHKWGHPVYEGGYNISSGWSFDEDEMNYQRGLLRRLGVKMDDTDIPESILGPALLEMRRVLSDNARSKVERHLRSGKINQRVLGKRAWAGDDRLFQKKRIPGKKSYAVILGIDISGSTVGLNIALAKRAALAQAELCKRAGVDFAIYAHTANPDFENGRGRYDSLYVDVYEVKAFDSPWNDTAKEALSKLCADSENLDGHTIEFYRKTIERHPATDKIILYYSDGKMPAANHDEELEILEREIAYCKAHNITLLGVGIRTDSPRRHGLDTVQVDDDSDVGKVVRHLQSALLHNR